MEHGQDEEATATAQPEKAGMGHERMDPGLMMRMQREPMLWTYFANIALGLWLIAGPATLSYESDSLTWNDILTGILVVALGVAALFPAGDFWGRWGICLAGIWLLFAPLVFWAPDPASYANETIVGALLVSLSVLVPMMPGKAHHMAMMAPGPDIPPGWSYNPSTWWQRGPIIGLGILSFLISRYLAAFQLEHTGSAWDPFFGGGTEEILTSSVSRAWPVSDAGLGSLAYLLETLSGFMGSVRRWRTMPWMVLMFGFLVIPLGVTSITLVVLQPVTVGTWCTLCLATAVAMLAMIPLAVDEVVATFHYMFEARREGQPLWRTFWTGGTLHTVDNEALRDKRSPGYMGPSGAWLPPAVWGVSLPLSLAAAALLGLWLMAAPYPLESAGTPAGDSNHLLGALVATVAVTAMAEPVRALRLANVAFGVVIIIAPWLLAGASTGLILNGALAGAAVLLLSLPRGPVRERYGPWSRYIF